MTTYNLSALMTARATAGTRYANAITELQASLIDLAALDAALSNRNVNNQDQMTFRKLPESLASLEHPIYAALLRDRLADKIAASRDTYIGSFAP